MGKRTRSILLISSEFPPNVGGIGNHAYNLAKSLSGAGYSITVVTNSENIPQADLDGFVEKQNFKIHFIKRGRFLLATYFSRLRKAMATARKVDTVICSGKFSLWQAIAIQFFFPKKEWIAVVHGSELDLKSSYAKKLTDLSLQKFSKIISVSAYTQKFLPKNISPKTKLNIIPNGIDTNEFSGNEKSHTKLPGNPSLITIGSVTERKGQENVIRALPEILKKYDDARYHIVGKPVLKKKFSEMASELGVQDIIKYYGAVSRQELLSTLQAAQIKLMLSNHTSDGDFEGFGIAVLEANAFGIPVIGSRNSGIADAIKDNETGILVDPKNTDEISKGIETILNDYERFSANALEHAAAHDWKKIVDRYIEVLGLI